MFPVAFCQHKTLHSYSSSLLFLCWSRRRNFQDVPLEEPICSLRCICRLWLNQCAAASLEIGCRKAVKSDISGEFMVSEEENSWGPWVDCSVRDLWLNMFSITRVRTEHLVTWHWSTSNDFSFFPFFYIKLSCDKLTSLTVCGEFLATRVAFLNAARTGALAFRCEERAICCSGTFNFLLFQAVNARFFRISGGRES